MNAVDLSQDILRMFSNSRFVILVTLIRKLVLKQPTTATSYATSLELMYILHKSQTELWLSHDVVFVSFPGASLRDAYCRLAGVTKAAWVPSELLMGSF